MGNVVAVNENELAYYQLQNVLSTQSVEILKGGIQIPTVGLSLPIYQGIGGKHMWLGASTLSPEQIIGRGNYVLLGHNVNNPKLLFSPLKYLEEENHDLIYLADAKREYVYQVETIVVVDQTEYEWLEKTTDEPVLTLVTCYGGDGTSMRRIIRANLLSIQDY